MHSQLCIKVLVRTHPQSTTRSERCRVSYVCFSFFFAAIRVSMKLQAHQLRLQNLLKDTIPMLCKNALIFNKGFVVDALIGVTTDDSSTFLLKLEETVGEVGGDDTTTEHDGSNGGGVGRDKSRSSRKRPHQPDTRSTQSKRRRSNNCSSDKSSKKSSNANVDTENTVRDNACKRDDLGVDDNDELNDGNDCSVNDETCEDNSTANKDGDQDNGGMVIVKPEQSDHGGQLAQVDQSQAEDTALDFSAFDVSSHDGSSTRNQSSATNDPIVSKAQQVHDLKYIVCSYPVYLFMCRNIFY